MEKKLSLSQQIAEIGAGLKFEDLPERVVNNSKMFIMDLLGNIIASRHVDSSLTCLKAVRELGDGDPVSTAIGCNYKTTPQMAALINGTFGHAFDMDDDHRYGTQHSSVVVFPAILALAEKYGCSGKDVLTAFAYGSEITIRLGEAFEGQTYYQGFHPTGTCGVFGATGGAAAGRRENHLRTGSCRQSGRRSVGVESTGYMVQALSGRSSRHVRRYQCHHG